MIIIKSPREIDLMREAGKVVGLIWEKIPEIINPGVSTAEINSAVERLMAENGSVGAEKGYYGYPASVCVSVNEQILHGIPSPKVILRDGDIVTLDLVVLKNGYMADSARTFAVGICGERQKRMIAIAKQCFDNAISLVAPGVHLGDICHAIGETAKANGCSVPRDYTGHGIGTHMHEDPYIPCYGTAGTGPLLREGMTLAIEPMVLEGKPEVRVLKDGWTVVSKDGKLTSHYENTVVVTKDGCEVLTYSEAEKKVRKEAGN